MRKSFLALQRIAIVIGIITLLPAVSARALSNSGNLWRIRYIFQSAGSRDDKLLQVAANNYSQAQAISSLEASALRGQIHVDLLQGRLTQATALLPDLRVDDPGNRFFFYELGIALYELGDVDSAFKLWRQYLPESVYHLIWRAERYHDLGQLDRQEQMLILAGRVDPSVPGSFYALGGLYWGEGRASEAITALDTAVTADTSKSARRYIAQGQIEFLKNQWLPAEVNFRAALEMDPDDPWAGYLLGTVLWNQHQISEARTAFQHVIDQHPTYTWALVGQARIYQTEKDYPQAESLLRLALQADPSLHLAYARLGEIYSDQHRLVEAQQAYQTALGLAPGTISYLLPLAHISEELGAIEQAAALYQAVLEKDPTNSTATERLKALGR